jgi:hypothetical protein
MERAARKTTSSIEKGSFENVEFLEECVVAGAF